MNNPLGFTDPTGHWGWSNIKKFVSDHTTEIVIAAVVVVAIIAAPLVLPAIAAAVSSAASAVAVAVASRGAGALNTVVNAVTGLSEASPAVGEASPVMSEMAGGEMLAAGGESTALSTWRLTQPGEVFTHYSTMENAAGLISEGLRKGSYVTDTWGLTASDAFTGLRLTHAVDAAFVVAPEVGTWAISHGIVLGGSFLETIFPFGTGLGTVFGGWPI